MFQTQQELVKVHLAFDHPIDPAMFQNFEVLKLEIHSRMAQAILRGKREVVEAKLRKQKPAILEIFDCTLEEVFLAQLEKREELQ